MLMKQSPNIFPTNLNKITKGELLEMISNLYDLTDVDQIEVESLYDDQPSINEWIYQNQVCRSFKSITIQNYFLEKVTKVIPTVYFLSYKAAMNVLQVISKICKKNCIILQMKS